MGTRIRSVNFAHVLVLEFPLEEDDLVVALEDMVSWRRGGELIREVS